MTRTTPVRRGALLGLTSAHGEVTTPRELAVEGEFPTWLTGSLLRNGPADWGEGTASLNHWFDGLAMLHHFSFEAGRVRYTSRFLASESAKAVSKGVIARREFATDPCRSIFRKVHQLFDPSPATTDNANVSVVRLGEQFLALTETPMAVAFDPGTLERLGVAYRAPGMITTAHPHHERGTGSLINYAAHLGARSSYRMFRVDPDTRDVTEFARVPVTQPAYMHSFGMSERYVVLTEFPLVVQPLRLALSDEPFIANYRWQPQRGTRFTVIARDTGTVVAQAVGEACFGFHHINAYDDGDTVVVDTCTASDASMIDDFYLGPLRERIADPLARPTNFAVPTRHTIDVTARRVTSRPLSDQPLDLPTTNHARAAQRPYTRAWGVGSDGVWIDRVVGLEVDTGRTREWREPDTYPGEPVFVARPGAQAEDDGVLLTVALDGARETSSLVVLDAASMEPLARADVGEALPYGLHGTYTSRR